MNLINKKDIGGFTLIEIVVVIVLLGIITIVAVPQFTNTLASKRLYDAIEKLNDDLNYCRDYAISQHTNTYIRFGIANNRYRLFYGDTYATRVALYDPARSSAAWFTINSVYTNVSLQSVSFASNIISFDWWGTPSEGGSVVLTNGTNTHTISVSAETGYVQR